MTPLQLVLARCAFSGAFGVAGVYLGNAVRVVFRNRQMILHDGVITEGEIVGFDEQRSTSRSGSSTLFAPVVTFKLPNGAPVSFKSSRAERPNPYVEGQRVSVRYLPNDPLAADLANVSASWFPIVALIIATIVCLTIAALPFLLAK